MTWTNTQQERLLAIISRRNERDHLAQQLTNYENQLQQLAHDLSIQYDLWQREEADVERLQRLSWASIYYDFLNQKEQQLSKEAAEAQQAHLRFDAIQAAQIAAQQQHDNLKKQLLAYATVDADYDALMEQKRHAMALRSDETGRQYQQQLDTIAQTDRHLNELKEAQEAGLLALNEILRLNRLLAEARGWGTWDLIGGSTISSMIKHNKLDQVRDQSYAVNDRLRRFQNEYDDLGNTATFDWTFDSTLTKFVDIFFDNIFTDWSVQSRIEKAQKLGRDLENRLVPTLASIKSQLENTIQLNQEQLNSFRHFLEHDS